MNRGSVCSIVRFKYIDGLGDINDFFWTATNISIWSLFEMATGIIAGSLATMRPLFKKIMYKARSITQVGRTRNPSSSRDENSKARMLYTGKRSIGSSSNKSQRSMAEWKNTVDSSVYTTTVIGGNDLETAEALADLDERGAQLINLRTQASFPTSDSWSPDTDRHRNWPFADETPNPHSIHKTVQVEVRSSQDDEPWARAGGTAWGQKMQDLLKTPARVRKGSKDDDSIPEWDKLPDLIPPSRKGSEDASGRAESPKLVRITTR